MNRRAFFGSTTKAALLGAAAPMLNSGRYQLFAQSPAQYSSLSNWCGDPP